MPTRFENFTRSPIDSFLQNGRFRRLNNRDGRPGEPMPENVRRLVESVQGFDFGKLTGDRGRRTAGPSNTQMETLPEPAIEDVEGTNAYAEALRIVDQIAPKVPGLDAAEQARYAELSQRSRRLQPVEFGVMGSAGIAGNPYSIDTRGLLTGLSGLAEGVINKERDKRLGEILPELTEYANRKASAEKNTALRQETLAKVLPEVYKQEQLNARNAADNTANVELEKTRNENRIELEKTRNENRIELEKLRHENAKKLEKIKNTGDGRGLSFSLMKEYVEGSTAEENLIMMQLEQLYKVKNSTDPVALKMWEKGQPADAGSIDEQINDLQKKYLDINKKKADIIVKMGQVPSGAVESEEATEAVDVSDIWEE